MGQDGRLISLFILSYHKTHLVLGMQCVRIMDVRGTFIASGIHLKKFGFIKNLFSDLSLI